MWELIFLMLIMKIPVVYLCWVVYWAIKSEPRPEAPATLVPALEQPPPWRPRPSRRRSGGPHGRPARDYVRSRRAVIRA